MRKLPIFLAGLMALAILVPAQAQAFKPKIIYVRATDESEGVHFTVKVRMDKGGADKRKVWVTYDGDMKSAEGLNDPPLSHFEAGPYAAPSRDCYRVEVKARNRFGTTTRSMRADMIGTDGCG